MKLLATAFVGFSVLLVILKNVASFVMYTFIILFFGYWGYQTLKDVAKNYRTWQQNRAVRKAA